MNFSFFLCLATCSTLSSACDTRSRPCVRCVLCQLAFPSAPTLGLPTPLPGCPALFVGFSADDGGVRLLTIVHHRLRLLAFPRGPAQHVYARCWSTVRPPGSPYKERPHMPSSPTTPGRASTSVDMPVRVAFRNAKSVGARDEVISAAQ